MKLFKLSWFLESCGKLANSFGKVDNYSDEHRDFLNNGFKCPKCDQVLMKSYGVADVNCYDKSGEKVPTFMIGFKGKYFECPKCNYQWDFRKSDNKSGIALITLISIIALVVIIYRFFKE